MMRHRCTNPKSPAYKHYGGKGIRLCDEWQMFEPFRDWARANGYREGMTIDRVKSDKGYSPGNCEWVTRSENSRRRHHRS